MSREAPDRARADQPFPALAPLLASCQKKITQITADLQWLLTEPALLLPANQPARFRALRRSVGELDLVETQGIAALERSHDDDLHLNELLARICAEVKYPLPTPVVTTLSQAYFRIIPALNLLCVPLSEARFLLHLPDLFHEIAHPLLIPPPTMATLAFQQAMAQRAAGRPRLPRQRGQGPRQEPRAGEDDVHARRVDTIMAVLGRGTDVRPVRRAHRRARVRLGTPPFEREERPRPVRGAAPGADVAPARCRQDGGSAAALALVGFQSEAGQVQDRWQQFLTTAGFRSEPEYRRCFPVALLEKVCQAAIQGVTAGNCRVAEPTTSDPIFILLNDAWREFWRAPDSYDAWELKAVEGLRRAA